MEGVNNQGQVTEIFLYQKNLGPIPKELGKLGALNTLALFNNKLTGPIPQELGHLTQLKFLNLGNNQLTGPIPEELGQLENLQRLDLAANQPGLLSDIPPKLQVLLQGQEDRAD